MRCKSSKLYEVLMENKWLQTNGFRSCKGFAGLISTKSVILNFREEQQVKSMENKEAEHD